MQNFLNFRHGIIRGGKSYLPMGGGRISFVDVRDIAAVAAETLEEHGHAGKEYDVTGSEALSYADTAEKLSFVLGKPAAYVDVPPKAARNSMLEAGIPEWTADGLLELYASWKFNTASEIATPCRGPRKKTPSLSWSSRATMSRGSDAMAAIVSVKSWMRSTLIT